MPLLQPHDTHLLKPSVTMCDLRRSEAISAAFSATSWSWDGSPGLGGFISMDKDIWGGGRGGKGQAGWMGEVGS